MMGTPPPEPKATRTNILALIMFGVLIIGFTFNLASILFFPLAFFFVGAAIIMARDAAARKNSSQQLYDARGNAVPMPHRMNLALKVILWAFAAIGISILCYVGFIVLVILMLGASGV
jgi:hypothetical protein